MCPRKLQQSYTAEVREWKEQALLRKILKLGSSRKGQQILQNQSQKANVSR